MNQQEPQLNSQLPQQPPSEDFDRIPLPSGGIQYKQLPENQRDTVDVAYMVAEDENLFFSPNLIESDGVLEVLINRKLLTKGLKYDDLLEGDVNALMFWLRATAYGNEYHVKLKDPETNKPFDHVIDLTLSSLGYLEPQHHINKRGNMEFKFPMCGRVVEYRYLTIKEEDALEAHDAHRVKTMGKNAVSSLMTDKMAAQIISIDSGAITNPMEIRPFVNKLRPIDSSAFRKHLSKNEFGVNMQINVQAPSGAMFRGPIPLGATFFFPDLSI